MYCWVQSPIHCVIIENVWPVRFKGTPLERLKVPPIAGCGSEIPELVYLALYYLGMEHPSHCIIELMYHCFIYIVLFTGQEHPELNSCTIILFTLYSHCIMYARTNWHKRAVRCMAEMCPGTTQHGLKAIELYKNKIQ